MVLIFCAIFQRIKFHENLQSHNLWLQITRWCLFGITLEWFIKWNIWMNRPLTLLTPCLICPWDKPYLNSSKTRNLSLINYFSFSVGVSIIANRVGGCDKKKDKIDYNFSLFLGNSPISHIMSPGWNNYFREEKVCVDFLVKKLKEKSMNVSRGAEYFSQNHIFFPR